MWPIARLEVWILMQTARLFDLQAFSERLNGDLGLLRRMVNLFIEECPSMVAAVGDALARDDAAVVHRAAHAMKGALLSMAANGVAETAGKLESAAAEDRLGRCRELLPVLESEAVQLVNELRYLG